MTAHLLLGLVVVLPLAGQSNLTFESRHRHLRGFCAGTLTVSAEGVSYDQHPAKKNKKLHHFLWTFDYIQQLTLEERQIKVLTYDDSRFKLGVDREERFQVAAPQSLAGLYGQFQKLDERFVAALPTTIAKPLFRLPVKHTRGLGGAQGFLLIGDDSIVFQAERASHSRTWRMSDIETFSNDGPYNLTFTTFERARLHYGSRKDFHFQLKQPFREENANVLWRRIESQRGSDVLSSYSFRKVTQQ